MNQESRKRGKGAEAGISFLISCFPDSLFSGSAKHDKPGEFS
jgi:hypothetical protein